MSYDSEINKNGTMLDRKIDGRIKSKNGSQINKEEEDVPDEVDR